MPEDLANLRRVDAEACSRRRCRCAERRPGEGQSGVDRRREPRRRAAPADVHVHHVGRLVQQVVVEGGLLDTLFLQLAEDGPNLGLEEHEVAHEHRLGIAHLLERDPGAERQGGLHRHFPRGDVQVAARQTGFVGPVRL